MGNFFEYFFSDVAFEGTETAVCCPFPHRTTDTGPEYYEVNPSAHVNISKGLFHCKVCNSGLNEASFIQQLLGCSYEDAISISKLFRTEGNLFQWEEEREVTRELIELCSSFKISEDVMSSLLLNHIDEGIEFPVFMYGKLVDVRSYTPADKNRKIKSRVGAKSGCIIPFDEWRVIPQNKWTIICAGEKDMAVTRSMGFDGAITLTGGERAKPICINHFKGRKIAICYDNDDTGIAGARSLAAFLQPIAAEVRVVTGFHEVCVEKGEDLTDFFVKYNKTKTDLENFIKSADTFTYEETLAEKASQYPIVTLHQASEKTHIGKTLQSNIQVIVTMDKAMPIPTIIEATKCNSSSDAKGNRMLVGQKKTWELSPKTAQDILKLMDNNFTELQIASNIRDILGISKYEKDIKIEKPAKETIYQCSVTDLFEATAKDVVPVEYNAYSLGKRLESGKKYLITYKMVPHPYKGQNLTMIILDVEEATDSVTNFKVDERVKENLSKIKNMDGTVEHIITQLTEMQKSFIGYDGYNQLIQAIDFSYNTVLSFDFGSFKDERGYLDTIIVAESRVGKSTTAETLQQLYGLGAFASLAGGASTVQGLIGGSKKMANGDNQTRAGMIPRNHRGLIVLEELAKCDTDLIKKLTDIRSSGKVRISRVSGDVEFPAMVRMVTLSNVKPKGGGSQPINSYPNGLSVIFELVDAPEDVARYDVILVLGETGKINADPFWNPPIPFDREVYQDRIRWIWSRTKNQIKINNEVGRYLVEQCNRLAETYNAHIKIFGTEAWKKVARLAIAMAGYTVSTDSTFTNIIVTKQHVEYAIKWITQLYDNSTFKLKEYCDNERAYMELDEDGLELLQDIYNQCATLVLQLEATQYSHKMNLQAAAGLDNELFNKFLNRLVRGLFIKLEGPNVIPTLRFRLGMSKINRGANIHRVGEQDA